MKYNPISIPIYFFSYLMVSCAPMADSFKSSLYVKHLKDPDSRIETKNIVPVIFNKNDLEAKYTISSIKHAMIDLGYNINDSVVEYFLFWETWNAEGATNSYLYLPVIQTGSSVSNTLGNIDGYNFGQVTTTTQSTYSGIQAIPVQKHYNFKKYRFQIYSREDLVQLGADSNFVPQLLWSGYCAIDNNDYKIIPYEFFKSCLKGIGQNREEDIKLVLAGARKLDTFNTNPIYEINCSQSGMKINDCYERAAGLCGINGYKILEKIDQKKYFNDDSFYYVRTLKSECIE